MPLVIFLWAPNLFAQQLEIEWDGSKQDVIRLVEGGKMRFSLEGHTASTPDRITFKIRSGDTLINALTLYEGGTVRLEKVDTILVNATNVVRKADGTLGVRQYKIGDFVHGGIVFWVDGSGEHGLIADTADISTGTPWSNGVEKRTNASGDGIGAGKMNIMLIIALQTIDNPVGNFAALMFADLRRGPFGDWYLPSKEELNLMFVNRNVINSTSLANGGDSFEEVSYWSSTEDSGGDAWNQNFLTGNQSDFAKLIDNRVRAIRAF